MHRDDRTGETIRVDGRSMHEVFRLRGCLRGSGGPGLGRYEHVERIAHERAQPVGQQVGYNIRLESKTSANTQLYFMTTGVLLRQRCG